MRKYLILLLIPSLGLAAKNHAKNVILFLGDAGGIPTLNAAGIYENDRPQSLFIQQMPHIALSDTSSLNSWVTDSAAGMTAIVTGQKTNNGWLSLLPAADGGDGRVAKTILEYAEERGLSTGVVTNMPIWDATPAACFAHVDSRKKSAEIFEQALHPRFGNGPEFLVGKDWKKLAAATEAAGWNLDQALGKAGYKVFGNPSEIPDGTSRAAAIYDGPDFEPEPVVLGIIKSLARNPKGFFLMVEWDMHTKATLQGIKRAIVMDNLIRKVAATAPKNTLILFAADHSFNFRLVSAKKGEPFAAQLEADLAKETRRPLEKPVVAVGTEHAGEEILVAGQGPGAERLHGFIPNTRIFHVMMDAYGWPESR
ncbi:MAG: alkaline phosphatase [Opitutaceae bacterium]|nr:alkaline phosphatase [Opitutaceae bacterium]